MTNLPVGASSDQPVEAVREPESNGDSLNVEPLPPGPTPVRDPSKGSSRRIAMASTRGKPSPLSFAQERLWFLHQLDPDTPAYHIAVAWRLTGSLNTAALSGAFDEIVRRHEILRSSFPTQDGAPLQVVGDTKTIHLEIEIVLHGSEAARQESIRQRWNSEILQPFDLERGPLLRGRLLVLGEQEHVLLITMHHIVSDGWSLGVFFGELSVLYGAFVAGEASPLPELEVQYADFAVWQRSLLQGERLERELTFWKDQLAGAPALLELPTDRPRPAVASYRGASERVTISSELRRALKVLSRREGVTLYMTMLAAFQVLLGRYAGQDNVVVGTPIAGRTFTETEGVIGALVNTLAVHSDLRDAPSFRTFLSQVRKRLLGGYGHQDFPFEKLVQALRPERNSSYTPVFQVMFGWQNVPPGRLSLAGLEVTQLNLETSAWSAITDLVLTLSEGNDQIAGNIVFRTDLFEAATIKRLIGHYLQILAGIVAEPDRPISMLPLLSREELEQSVVEWNRTGTEYPREKCVHEVFEEQVERAPAVVAVMQGERQITYGDLNGRANQLAHHLRGLGVGAEVVVGICLERSIEMVVALLGILKAGGVYLPLDPDYPEERLKYMLKESGAVAVVTTAELRGAVPCSGIAMVCVDGDDSKGIAQQLVKNPVSLTTADNAAYVVYTSGSTGVPKGICIPHRGVNRLVINTNYVDLDGKDVVAQISTLAFDAAAFEIWGALLNGSRLVIFRKEQVLAEGFADELEKRGITTLFLITSLFNHVSQQNGGAFRSIRQVLFGGEAVDPQWVKSVMGSERPQRLLHMYGPAEGTTLSTFHEVGTEDGESHTVPIGRGVANTQVYVLDGEMQPVPMGVIGELYIGGEGLARGYVNRPDVTGEKFVPDPFGPAMGGRLYRTGDLVKWQARGALEFIGRRDHQVKIRGYRIEPGEIEAILEQHPAVAHAVVIAREDRQGEKHLVAYVVAAGEPPSDGELRAYLGENLPSYMLPTFLVKLAELPLTSNGKVDRRALPLPEVPRDRQLGYVAPGTPTEDLLATIWGRALGLERVGVHDNFFELGGHSLLATRVTSQVERVFGVHLGVKAIFDASTISKLSRAVQDARQAHKVIPLPFVSVIGRGAPLPLSYAQERLWFLEQLVPDNALYNMPLAFRIAGPLSVDGLVRALNELVRRHEILRTSIVSIQGRPQQVIAPVARLRIPINDLSSWHEDQRESEVKRLIQEEAIRPFDFSEQSLLRAGLLRLGDREHVLLLTMHHIVSDGWSLGVLTRELEALYESYSSGGDSPLPELSIQYADYTVWQRSWLRGELLQEQLGYWRERLNNAPLLQVPTDRTRPLVMTHRGATHVFALPERLSQLLKEITVEAGVTFFMMFLAAFKVLLYRYTGQKDVVVGTPSAGRSRGRVENLIGFFVNTLVLRTDLAGDPSFRVLLGRVRTVCLEAYEHDDVPFGIVVDELQPQRRVSQTPFFEVMFALQNAQAEQLKLSGLQCVQVAADTNTAKFDLGLSVQDLGRGFLCAFEYSTDLFEAATIERMAKHFERLLEGIAIDPATRISELPLLTEEEWQRVLVRKRTNAVCSEPRCVQELFEEQVDKNPGAVALIYEGTAVTYRELNGRANQLARYLRKRGVGPEKRVALCLDRCIEMVVGMLGILKAGGTYVPMDPAYPPHRLAKMTEDTKAVAVLTQKHLRALSWASPAIVELDGDLHEIANESQANLAIITSAQNAAYVIYTSGSKGQPKGVVVTHQSLADTLQSWVTTTSASSNDVTAALASSSFDLSLLEMISPWLAGGASLVLSRADVLDSDQLVKRLEPVTCLYVMPSLMRQVMAALQKNDKLTWPKRLRSMSIGGDLVDPDLLRDLRSGFPNCVIRVAYGPTEATIMCANEEMGAPDQGKFPIGRPTANATIYVLDETMAPVPEGVAGELHIGGAGVARAYLNRPDLTAEKFVPDPFAEVPGMRLYRTGDLGRSRNGSIDFLGRVDDQVKVRGYRIEPGEIEAALREYAGIRDAAVLAREDRPGEKWLVAYVESRWPAPSIEQLRTHLQARLPEYMIPGAFIVLDALPVTPNGKIDRRALPPPSTECRTITRNDARPLTPLEEILAEIWAEVLGLESVRIDENFFELGGQSLLAMRVVWMAREALQREFPVRLLFEAPTVAQLASRLERQAESETDKSIPPLRREKREIPPLLSFAQERLWLAQQLEPESPAYHIPIAIRLKGRLDIGALERGLSELTRRHEILRTTFRLLGENPIQEIAVPGNRRLAVENCSHLNGDERAVAQIAAEEAVQPFDLERGPLLRGRLLVLGEQEHVLLITMHHIVSDGWSLGVFFGELSVLYGAFVAGEASPLPELEVQYADFAVWQRSLLQGERLERELTFWKDQLAGAPALLELPTDRPRPAVASYRGASERVTISSELRRALKVLSRREGVTLYMTMLAAFQVLLGRYAGQDNVVVGTSVAARTHRQTESLVGPFFNVLPLRADLSGDPTFRTLLVRTRDGALAAYAHQDMPFEKLVEELHPQRNLSSTPLFQVIFELHQPLETTLRLSDLGVDWLDVSTNAAKVDLTLTMYDASKELFGRLEYNTDLFNAATIQGLIRHLGTLLEGIAANPNQRLSELPLLTPTEREHILADWNSTKAAYADEQCVHELFEAQVMKTPRNIALEYQGDEITYKELDEMSNRMAHYLRRFGVGPENRVALCIERTPKMIIALLGILKAGGAYVPLDPTHPAERLAYMLGDSGAMALLTNEKIAAKLPLTAAKVVRLDADWDMVARESADIPPRLATSENLACIYYTSGSTGRPKGVAVPHRGLVNYFIWGLQAYGAVAGNGAPVHSSIAVDLTLTNFLPLFAGERVVLVPESLDVSGLVDLIRKEPRWSLLKLTPTHLALLNPQLTPAEMAACAVTLVIGADNLVADPTLVWRDEAPAVLLINEYGPTETVVGCSVYEIDEASRRSGPIPIGRPIANTTMYVLDRRYEPVPVGVHGELHIGGVGVARGYWQRPGLTAEKFVPDPFAGISGGRMYKTGDRARYLQDGNLEFLGRLDNQVKVRGFRIELGEIEATLSTHPCVQKAIVIVREEPLGEKQIAAYVSAPGHSIGDAELRSYLKDRLPGYMVPQTFVVLDELPVGPSGKIDPKSLPAPEPEDLNRRVGYVSPVDPIELQLVQIWEEVLKVKPVGTTDDFFELGGHSLSAVQLQSKVRERFAYRIPLSTLVGGGAIRDVASALRGQVQISADRSVLVPIQPCGTKPPLFCVHPAGGGVLCYVNLARHLGFDQPVYGLQDPFLNEDAIPSSSVSEMAAAYVRAVRELHPAGPYHLAGWSFGGIVAFEMAQQLRAGGQEVAFLGVLDSPNPVFSRMLIESDEVNCKILAGLARELALLAGKEILLAAKDLAEVCSKDRFRFVAERLKAVDAIQALDSPQGIQRTVELWWSRMKALQCYEPIPYSGPLTLFRALEADPRTDDDFPELMDLMKREPTQGWSHLSTTPVEILDVPGHHATMGREPHVRVLAEELSKCLARSVGHQGSSNRRNRSATV